MEILNDYSLKSFNSFGINARAKTFIRINSVEELRLFFREHAESKDDLLILGGGSNILFTSDFDGIILKMDIKGIHIVEEDEEYVYLKAMAGEEWDSFVEYCVKKGWGGLENLSMIPGQVGSSPIQNIGAYGAELKDSFYELKALDPDTLDSLIFSASECNFGYRNSVFKNDLKGKYIITSVSFKLRKKPSFNLNYKALQDELKVIDDHDITLDIIRKAVMSIRSRKLPDPAVIGNAGSFFKNPVISSAMFHSLKAEYPGLVSFQNDDDTYKVAAGWLIEACGWKGFRRGDAGVHKDQALVIVNYGNASGKEILGLSYDIQASVLSKFNIPLEREVNVI